MALWLEGDGSAVYAVHLVLVSYHLVGGECLSAGDSRENFIDIERDSHLRNLTPAHAQGSNGGNLLKAAAIAH